MEIHTQNSDYIHRGVNSQSWYIARVQYTCFSLSDLEALIDSADTNLTKPSFVTDAEFDWLVKSVDDLYHVMLAWGLHYDVVHVMFICCPL